MFIISQLFKQSNNLKKRKQKSKLLWVVGNWRWMLLILISLNGEQERENNSFKYT